jgi:L-fuculose-phosphate aldolase
MELNMTTLREDLIALGVELVERGHVLGSGGNLSYRQDNYIYITRSGAQLHQLGPADFLPVALDQPYVRPSSSPRPSTETPKHLAAYHARPQARVIVNCHPRHALAWAMQQKPLPACRPDFALYLGESVPVLPFYLPGAAVGEAITPLIPHHPALLLGNHGVLVAAENVARARLRLLHIEETAHICLLAAAAGQVRPLRPDEYAQVIATYGRKAG